MQREKTEWGSSTCVILVKGLQHSQNFSLFRFLSTSRATDRCTGLNSACPRSLGSLSLRYSLRYRKEAVNEWKNVLPFGFSVALQPQSSSSSSVERIRDFFFVDFFCVFVESSFEVHSKLICQYLACPGFRRFDANVLSEAWNMFCGQQVTRRELSIWKVREPRKKNERKNPSRLLSVLIERKEDNCVRMVEEDSKKVVLERKITLMNGVGIIVGSIIGKF